MAGPTAPTASPKQKRGFNFFNGVGIGVSILSGLVAVVLAVPQLREVVLGKPEIHYDLTNKALLLRLYNGIYNDSSGVLTSINVTDSTRDTTYVEILGRQPNITATNKEQMIVSFLATRNKEDIDGINRSGERDYGVATFQVDEPGKGSLLQFNQKLVHLKNEEEVHEPDIVEMGVNNYGLLLQVLEVEDDDYNEPVRWRIFQVQNLHLVFDDIVHYFNSGQDLDPKDDGPTPAIIHWPQRTFAHEQKNQEYYDLKVFFKGKHPLERSVEDKTFYFADKFYTFDYNKMKYDLVQGDWYTHW